MTQQRPEEESAAGSDADIEAPEPDVADQQATAEPPDEATERTTESLEVDSADAAEQQREVEFDEDEYR